MSTFLKTAPGIYDRLAYSVTNIFVDPLRVEHAPFWGVIDGNLSRDTGSSPTSLIRAGMPLGKITTTGKLRSMIIGVTALAIAAGATTTSITVPAAVAKELARLISYTGGNVVVKFIGPPTAAGTVATTSVTVTAAAGTTLTVTSVNLPAYAAGSIIAPADGSETPITLQTAGTGVDVADEAGNGIDQSIPHLLRKADLITDNLPFYSSLDASVKTWLKTQLKNVGLFTFDDAR